MPDCCSSKKEIEQRQKQRVCPVNGKQYLEVPVTTVLHHVGAPWKHMPKEQAYYFCEDPKCEVIYFGYDNLTITKDQLRTKVGIKEISGDALICYCFGVTKVQAQTDQQAKLFVMAQTKNSRCSCKTFNPSGRCCLKDFPKQK